ncbi:hypothetical protein PIROE2DRAFT_8341 [Piromyces sp. E2]|nr:hypothetical protein PIROE2DRAFT_8341 [Piromyces sp. E2]|eukprot:OUM64799.1 hypothetical protein PIROE2DRAFT_8341 [Piromyces sp. E2]
MRFIATNFIACFLLFCQFVFCGNDDGIFSVGFSSESDKPYGYKNDDLIELGVCTGAGLLGELGLALGPICSISTYIKNQISNLFKEEHTLELLGPSWINDNYDTGNKYKIREICSAPGQMLFIKLTDGGKVHSFYPIGYPTPQMQECAIVIGTDNFNSIQAISDSVKRVASTNHWHTDMKPHLGEGDWSAPVARYPRTYEKQINMVSECEFYGNNSVQCAEAEILFYGHLNSRKLKTYY